MMFFLKKYILKYAKWLARKFLINPGGLHFSIIKASDLILVDANDVKNSLKNLSEDRKPLVTAIDLHSNIHKLIKNAGEFPARMASNLKTAFESRISQIRNYNI